MSKSDLLAERSTGLGGSDIAGVLSVGYGCALRLYRQKTGEVPDFPREDTDLMALGNILEPFFADKYARETGHKVEVVGVQRDPEHPELLVHADRILTDPSQPQRKGVLEIKSVGAEVFYKVKKKGLVPDYLLQLQYGMAVWRLDWGAFAVGCRDNGKLVSWPVQRDEELCEIITERSLQAWESIQKRNPPQRLDPEDERCQKCEYRRSCQGAALMSSGGSKGLIPEDESMRPLLVEYDENRKLYQQANDLLEATKARIRDALGQRVEVRVAGRPVYNRWSSRTTWNAKKMADGIARAQGKVDYDGTFLPAAPKAIEAEFKEEGEGFQTLRVY